MITTNKKAKECIDTNYYCVKNFTRALLPLLQRFTYGARIEMSLLFEILHSSHVVLDIDLSIDFELQGQ
nr:short-chain dehydrogenase/reductase 2b-like [Tanacetum cinerariifolium]